jgi:hypothetical protein
MSHSPASRLGLARLKKDLKVLEQQPRFLCSRISQMLVCVDNLKEKCSLQLDGVS